MRAAIATVLFLAALAATATTSAQSSGSKNGKDSKDKDTGPTSVGGKTLAEWKKQLGSVDASKRSSAIMAVMQFSEDDAASCVPQLIKLTQDKDVSPRAKAILALRFVGVNNSDVPKVVAALATRMNPNNESQAVVRYEAALTLKRYHKDARSAIPALIVGTRDKGSWELRHQCAWILWRVAADKDNGPDKDAVDALLALLRNDSTYAVRLEAIQGLGGIGLPKAPAQQQAVLTTLHSCTSTKYPENRPLTIWAFASLVNLQSASQGKESLNKLAKYLKSADLEIRAQAAQALGSLGDKAKPKLADLIAMLDDKETVAIQAGCQALVGVADGGDKVVDALTKVVDHKDPGTAAAAVVALFNLKAMNARVTAKLGKMLKDDKLHIGLRGTIEQALKMAKGKKTGK